MIDIMILYELTKNTLTMYGISKEIKSTFSVMTMPSFGTIKPALNRLLKNGFVKNQKEMSAGGRPSTYYSITNEGKDELKKLLLNSSLDNSAQFLTAARIKIICSEILAKNEKINLYKTLKMRAESILIDINNLVNDRYLPFLSKMVYDNLICEYKNFISLSEGLEHAGTGE